MARESLHDRYLEVLEGLGGSAGNGRLQTELGWQDATYARVQAALIEEGRIVKGRGRGGSVSLAQADEMPTVAATANVSGKNHD